MSIRVENVSKSFHNFVALENVTFDFPSGELVALLGPSGCGKTTLLRVIAGMEVPDSGRVFLEGQDASDTHVRERQVGFVFQHYALFRHMSVFDNVAFGLRMKPRKQRPSESDIRKRVHDLLNLVQLDWLADRFPAQLSGGQRQRIALARALAVEPRVLLLDEPFGALDAKVRKELRRWLRRLHDELHITSIFVTHDQEEALEVADRVVLMNHGRIEQAGTPNDVYEHPATPFVYGFLGAVNFFHGRIEGEHLHTHGAALPHDNTALEHGDEAVGFVRPHDVEIVTESPGVGAVQARIARILSFGATARIELVALPETPQGHYYEAEVPREQVAARQLAEGKTVWLKPSQMRVFPRDPDKPQGKVRP